MKKIAAIFCILLCVAFFATSCGKGTGSEFISKEASIEKATDPSKLPQVAKDRKDSLIVGITAPNGEFNPIYTSSKYDSWVTSLTFDGMISNDAAGNPIPWIAEKWDVTNNDKTYTFYLNKGVKFINGEELTAKDVEFTFTAICDPKYDGARFDAVEKLVGYEEYHNGDAATVSGIKVIDEYTISFTLTDVKAPAIYDFGYGIMPVSVYGFEKGDIQKLKDKFLDPVGSGPYKLDDYKAGQEVSFVKNPDYWKGEPKIERVIMRVTSAQTRIQELTTGNVDVDIVPANPENVQLLKDAEFLDLQFYPANQYAYIGLNHENPKLSDKNVRQALAYGFNREGFVNTYYKGYSVVCNVPISQVSWAYTEDINKYPFDPEKAKTLLDDAGWKVGADGIREKDGVKLSLNWKTYTDSKYVDTLIPILTENWKDIGVELNVELMEFATLSSVVFDNRDFEIFNMAWSLSIDPDPLGIFGESQNVPGGFNCGGWVNPESERLMQEGIKTTDQAERKKIYNEWAKICTEDLPYIFVNNNKELFAVSSRVKNMNLSSYIDWTMNLYLTELE